MNWEALFVPVIWVVNVMLLTWAWRIHRETKAIRKETALWRAEMERRRIELEWRARQN